MHLIIELLTFIHYNLDLRKKHEITLTIVDYHKAFNRQDHNNFLVILHKMGVTGWLLRIIAGFLEERTMTMAFKQGRSKSKPMPGGIGGRGSSSVGRSALFSTSWATSL